MSEDCCWSEQVLLAGTHFYYCANQIFIHRLNFMEKMIWFPSDVLQLFWLLELSELNKFSDETRLSES